MAVIRRIEIENFRSIKSLHWCPRPGFNCLVGPGDAGKTTILDAIDYCLGARRNLTVTDADFHGLDVTKAISIKLVLGGLEDALKDVDVYGEYLRGYDRDTDVLEEEPLSDLETVLWLHLTIAQDLEPVWLLHSARAAAKGMERNIRWADRDLISPLRLGAGSDINLAWKRGSLLNKLSDETPDVSETLSNAAREARRAFGETAQEQLEDALEVVEQTASDLGVRVGSPRAMLDVHAVSFGSGTVSLHNEVGVPLRNMGTGSKRLLISGMQDRAYNSPDVAIVDELEIGLEPHRIIRFLKSLGSKDEGQKRQVFATSHSPIVLQELDHSQVNVVRLADDDGSTTNVLQIPDTAQGLLRVSPSAFLAKSVIVCEGKTEVGFLRGIDLHRVQKGQASLDALGISLMDCDGGSEKRPFQKADVLQALGYRVAIFIDNDREIPSEEAEVFEAKGGKLFYWQDGQSIEDAIFSSAGLDALGAILELATDLNEHSFLVSRVASASDGDLNFEEAVSRTAREILTQSEKETLGRAAGGKNGWFKDIDRMEQLARKVIAPHFKDFDEDFRKVVLGLVAWQKQ
jgi:hypothetical protein